METNYIVGIEKLDEETKAMFYKFLEVFISRQGTAGKESFIPLKVKLTSDKANGKYLRFDYKMYGRKNWMHVKSPRLWY